LRSLLASMAQKSAGWRTNAVSARCSRSERDRISDRIVALRPSSAYLLFTGSRLVSVWLAAVLEAAGSPASGEEGFAPAGFIFAAGVLAFAAAVPAIAFSPLGVPAASNDEIGAAARVSAKAKVHVLFSITHPPCAAHGRGIWLERQEGGVGGITFDASR
jgi:hypothetical protein